MTYVRTLVTRWTRRDWLAIAVVALAVAFLVGTGITVLATSATVTDEVESLDALEQAAYGDAQGLEGTALPVATVETADGTETWLVGVPAESMELSSAFDDATLEAPPPGSGMGGPVTGEVEFRGSEGTVTLAIEDAPQESVLPARWVRTRPAVVREAGQTATIALGDGGDGAGIPGVGTLLLGTPAFLVGGGRALVELLALVTLASGLLVGVTVYSVTRMTVRDRRRALFVVRATGGGRRRLVGVFALRAGLLTGVGTLFGYAIGVILVHAILNVATYHGQLTTLDLSGTPTDRLVLGTMAVAVVGIGVVAGALSVARTALAEPGALMGASGNGGATTPGGLGMRVREALGLEILGVRSIVPMTATLSVFVAIAVLTVSLGVTLAPLAGATDGVVMAPDADYPLESEVDRSLAEPFRAAGIPASPEVLLPQVRDGQPYLLRGAEFESFATVSDAALVEGTRPGGPDEAVVGVDLARTIGVGVGDEVTLGGGTAFGLDRVTVVGTFRGPGYVDDQLIVPLATAQGLANLDASTVQVIRTTGAEVPPAAPAVGTPVPDVTPTPTGTTSSPTGTSTATPTPPATPTSVPTTTPTPIAPPTPTTTATPTPTPTATPTPTPTPTPTQTPGPSEDIVIESVSVPSEGIVNTSIPIRVTLENRGDDRGTFDLDATIGNDSETRRVTFEGGGTESVTFRATFAEPGRYDVTVNDVRRELVIRRPTDVSVSPIPDRAPPNATVLVTVRNASGDTLQGATVEIGSRSTLTSADGVASVGLPDEPGVYPYAIRAGDRLVANGTIRVEADAPRTLLANLTLEPERVELPNDVTVTAAIYNPWAEPLTQQFVLEREGEPVVSGPVGLPPAGSVTASNDVTPVTAAGEQGVVALFDGEQVDTATYSVEASDRLIALLARLGLYVEGSSLVRSLKALVGNLGLLQATVFALAFLMGVGSTATVIVQGTHARRRSIGIRRVTGADARRLTKDLLLDSLQLGALASVAGTLLAYAGLWAFVAGGYTTVFGVRIQPLLAPWLLGVVLLGALALVAASALVAAWWVLSLEPGALLTESTRRTPKEESERASLEAGGR